MAEQQQQQQQHQERGVELDQNQFLCSVCLELLKEPVAIPCGHNYCKGCIEGCWDQEEEKGEHSCPQCRETFNPRPVLRRNNVLAEVVEMLKRTSTHQASPSAAVSCAGPTDVACDFCCGTERSKATMSCLTCLASYCPAHLELHYTVPVLKKHQLVSATIPLEQKMCAKHNKLMEVYCQTDKTCICYLCIIDEHKSHCTVSAAAERAVEQEQLIAVQKDVQEIYQEQEKELNELIQALKDFKSCSKTAVETSDEIFDELIAFIKHKRTLAKQLIEAREKTAVAQAEELQLRLEEEITRLKSRDTEMEQLSHTNDNIHFIQTFQSLSTACQSPDLPPGSVVRPKRSFKTVTDCLSQLRDEMEILLNDTWPRISATVSTIDVVLPPDPKTREEFLRLSKIDVALLSGPSIREVLLRYCCPLTLDENSVSKHLSVSQEHQRVTVITKIKVQYNALRVPPPPTRVFTGQMNQVLCREGLSKRCYWEVNMNGQTWSVAVSYSSLSHDSQFGNDNKSWSLDCSPKGYSFRHNKRSRRVSGPRSSTIGVFLDYMAGTLSFYSVSDTMTLLHKEHITFTRPLYPGLGLRDEQSHSGSEHYAELIKLW